MLISGFPNVGLKVDETRIEGGVPGCVLVVGPDGELAQMIPMVTGLGHAQDDGRAVRVDGSDHERHIVLLEGDRDLVVAGDPIGQETVLICRQGGEGGHELIWPSAIAWKNGAAPRLEETHRRTTVVRLLKVDDGAWLGWSDGYFY
jgi:hypothetical protein